MKGHKNSGQCHLDVVIIKYGMTNLKAGILIFCTCDEKSVECGYQVAETTFCLSNGLNLFPLVLSLILCVLMCSLHYHGILALAYSIMF